jgi:transposase-like protein
MARTYTDAERVTALARLELNAGNASRTARELSIPRPTLLLWRDQAVNELSGIPDTVKTDWAELFGSAVQLGARLIAENLRRYQGQTLKPSELRDVAVVTGIAVDKHLDYRDGRKTSSVNVDARSVNLTQLTDEQLARLRDGH